MLKTMKTIALAGLTSAIMAGAGAAATMHEATSTFQNHSFYFGNNLFNRTSSSVDNSKSWQFETVGSYLKYTQGGMNFARLTGTIQQNGNSTNKLAVDAVFKLRGVGDAFKGADRKCGKLAKDNTNGGCIGDDNWSYYNFASVVLTGIGDLAGLSLELSDTTKGDIPAQEGFGANDKDKGFGFSTWFDWEVTKAGNTGFVVGSTGKGDINIKLGEGVDANDPEPVPLPAGGVLLLTALGGLGLARRRKAKAT